MGRAPSLRIKGPLGSGNSLLHRQTKTNPKGGCLTELPPAELYLGGASCLQQDNQLLLRQLFQAHLISLGVVSMSGAPQNRQHREKLHSRLAAQKATAWWSPLRWGMTSGISRERTCQLQRPQDTKVFASCILATESEWGERCFFLYEI